MNYRRVMLLVELGTDARQGIAAIRRVAPDAEALVVLAASPGRKLPWLADETADAPRLAAELRAAAVSAARNVEVKLAPELEADTVAALARESRIDLLALDEATGRTLSLAAGVRKRVPLPVLCPGKDSPSKRPVKEVLCMGIGSRARRAVAAFLRDQGGASFHATVLAPPSVASGDLAATHDVTGIETPVTFARAAELTGVGTDLLVVTRLPALAAMPVLRRLPILVLPPLPVEGLRRAIDVPDLVEDAGILRARFLYAAAARRHEPIPDQEVAFVAGGRVAALEETRDGDAEVPSTLGADALGVFRTAEKKGVDPVSAVEEQVRVIRPGSRPLVLFDAGLDEKEVSLLGKLAGPGAPELLAVRVRPLRSCRSIRGRLQRNGLPPFVVDASAVLDEGPALDVGEHLDGVRLARAAARMRGAGFPVAAIVHKGPHSPVTVGFEALEANEACARTRWPTGGPSPVRSLAGRLDAVTGAPTIGGNLVEVELDNSKARHWLLNAIAQAKRRVHLQTFMGLDDDVGSPVESALAAAGARGVAVRVLVDSLHGFEGSFGARNPLFERLKTRPGVELKLIKPITGAPSVEDLKQRNHRKIAVFDGTLALIGGRNLSHEYYTGFAEVKLTSKSLWRQVPWLDAGARVEGPAAAALDSVFSESWTEAGGSPFDIGVPAPAGTTPVRVVAHQGLRDARTLDAYLALIDSAASHVDTVNGFPLVLEIQNALLRAICRGVRVRCVVGSLTPTHGGKLFRGPWSTARAAATEFVHSRLDAIVAAGGEGYVYAVPEQPGWEAGLGVIQPHVHAKVLSVDGRVCAVGSANLDVTAGYWDSEAMLVVEDPAITGTLGARIDEIIATSKRFDRYDAAWRHTAIAREWMRRWPGVLTF